MEMLSQPSRWLRIAALVAAAGPILLASCARVDVPDPLPGPTTTTGPASADTTTPPGRPLAVDQSCDPYETLPPSENLDLTLESNRPEPGTYLSRLRGRRELRVGVDIATPQLSSLDPRTGTFEGFEIDLVRHIAAALFDQDPDDVDDRIVFVAMHSADRTAALTASPPRVDLVASAYSITCARRREIDFSAPYLVANQRILVDVDDEAEEPEDLSGRTICTTEGSTAESNLRQASPDALITTTPERGECLVRLQTGAVDAMATDDAILAGMATQDETLEVRGEPYSSEPYGLGLPPGNPDWLRYVNGVLAGLVADGTWDELYEEYFGDILEPAEPPEPVYTEDL